MRRHWLALAALVILPAGVRAGDSTAGTPYDFQVLLRVGTHRLLTDTFRRQLGDELRDGLQSAFGPLATVRVQDVATDAETKAAWLDPAAADAPAPLGPAKRHFVAVDFSDGQYTIRARQSDGSTGLASPLVRQARTADRRFVGRQILRFIHEDFGAVGTVARSEGMHVWLQLRGGSIPSADLARWVPAGSVFALVKVRSDGASAETIPATYLRAVGAPLDGRVECELFSRYQNPLLYWPQNEYRAMRLGTTRAALRLRVTDTNGQPQASLQVRVSRTGFKAEEVHETGIVRDGLFDSRDTYDGLALVRISTGGVMYLPVPVPILDDRRIELSVSASAADEAKETVVLDARREQRALHDILRRLREQYQQLGPLLKDAKNREALDRLQAGLEVLEQEHDLHAQELSRLRAEGRRAGADVAQVLDACDGYLRQIREFRGRMQVTHTKLMADQAAANSPEALEKRDNVSALLQKVQVHLEAAEFEEAIETYKQILNLTGESESIRKKLTDLEEAWKTKGPEHEQARRFAYQVWPKLATFDALREKLPQAREAFEVCKSHRDWLTTKKLYLVATDQVTKILLEAAEDLKQSESDVAALLRSQINKATQDLKALIKDMETALEGREGK
jgi:tetratricopeptide (TPR) repeat protein